MEDPENISNFSCQAVKCIRSKTSSYAGLNVAINMLLKKHQLWNHCGQTDGADFFVWKNDNIRNSSEPQ